MANRKQAALELFYIAKRHYLVIERLQSKLHEYSSELQDIYKVLRDYAQYQPEDLLVSSNGTFILVHHVYVKLQDSDLFPQFGYHTRLVQGIDVEDTIVAGEIFTCTFIDQYRAATKEEIRQLYKRPRLKLKKEKHKC